MVPRTFPPAAPNAVIYNIVAWNLFEIHIVVQLNTLKSPDEGARKYWIPLFATVTGAPRVSYCNLQSSGTGPVRSKTDLHGPTNIDFVASKSSFLI